MAENHLENLVGQWLELRGFYVRRNVPGAKLPGGGYSGELDVVAFHPKTREILHYECSTDASSWEKREKKFKAKLETGRTLIPKIFEGLTNGQETVKQYVVLVVCARAPRTVAGVPVLQSGQLIKEILTELKANWPMDSRAVPEQFSLIRTLQLVTRAGQDAVDALTKKK
jgi:hypothetical protein